MVSIRTITIYVVCMIVTGSIAVALDWHFTEPNIALNKTTTQSSTGFNGVSNRAVDGNNNADYHQGNSCTHTSVSGASAWWAVYLAGNYKVSGIIIYNRNSNKNRLRGFKVIGQTASSTSVVLYDDSNANHPRYNDLVIPIQLDDARLFSSINITIPSVPLTLCEVQIFAACQPPTAIPNGKYSSVQDGYGVGSMITATCDNGYKLIGTNQMTCQRNGSWSAEPKCIDDSCNNPNDLINGKYISNGVIYESGKRMLGNVITVVCDLGYKLTSGPSQRTCTLCENLLSNMYVAWNGTSPTCSLITCAWPETFTGGHYEAQNQITDKNSIPYGTILHAACGNDLFNFTGTENRTCGDNSIWSGAAPSCVALCNAPNVTNGRYETYGSELKTQYEQGQNISIKCDDGDKFNSTNTERTCGTDHQWNGEVDCNVALCNAPNITNGHYNKNGSTLQNQYEKGQQINIICDDGFKLNGNNTEITCGTNHLWNGEDVDCNVTLCNAPNVINGRYEIKGSTLRNQYEQGQQINIICEDGYELITTERICGTDHQWKGGDVDCKAMQSSTEAPKGGSTAIIGGSAAGAVVLIVVCVAAGVMIYRRRRTTISNDRVSKRYAQRTPAEICTPNPGGVYVNIQEIVSDNQSRKSKPVPAPKPDYSNQCSKQSDHVYYGYVDTDKMPERAIKVEALSDIVFTGDAATETYKTQFDSFPQGMNEKHVEALKPKNKPKNRYKNLYAYDDTRVILNADNDKSESDYINANYIHGFGQPQAYVASQGATKENIIDIWRMIWQLDSGKIVMLTNLREAGKDKCDQYWPTEGSTAYGKITVTLRETEKYSDFIIRTLAVCLEGADERVVQQFHFTAWPDKSVPKYASSIVSFRNKVKYTASKGKGPIVVHCSAGIGRTGTFIAIDYLTEQAHALGYIDVAGCVQTLRRQRVNMVQTLDQYIFIHQALVEMLMLAVSAIPSSRFPEAYKELLEIDPVKRKRKLNVQFELLKKMSPVAAEHEYASAKIVRNRNKNRYTNIIPVDEFMPHLKPTGTEEDYINAVFLPSYKEKRAFIITQTPLVSTKDDFWRLICDHEVQTIVMMDDITELKEGEMYWPEEGTCLKFGDISVNHLACEEFDAYRTIAMQVERKEKTRTIKQIQCKQWTAGSALPDKPLCILSLMEVVQSWQQGTGNHPVVVHCMNGADKSGLFCVISAVIERMKIERDVAISQVIEEMRNSREQIITSVEQFQFCHDAVCAFMEQFETYSNFSA